MSAETGSRSEADRQELIEFYKEWLSDALTRGLAGMDTLAGIRDRLKLSEREANVLRFHGIDIATEASFDKIQAVIDAEVADAANDINRHVFDEGMFEAYIIVDEVVLKLDGVAPGKEELVPLIGGQAYAGPIDRLEFRETRP